MPVKSSCNATQDLKRGINAMLIIPEPRKHLANRNQISGAYHQVA